MLGKIIAFIAVAAVAVDACSYPIIPSAGCVPSCLPTVYPDVLTGLALATAGTIPVPSLLPSACGYPGVYPYGFDAGLYSTAFGLPSCGIPSCGVPACGIPTCGVPSYLPGLAAPYYGC